MSQIRTYEVNKYISELQEHGLEFLPNGIIEKSHTGMGATHMEIISPRNSIIVEPVKITAYSKVIEYNKTHEKHINKQALYVGSEIGLQKKSTSNKQIKEYLLNKNIKYKKIICVADSLKRVVEELLQAGKFEDYFLLIDEIDSIQNDSSYRMSLENCLDIYFMFNSLKRAVLTATPLDFTNDELKNEPKSIFKLKSTKKTTVDFYNLEYSSEVHFKILTSLILDKYNENNGTVVIVLNSIKSIEILITTLIKNDIPKSHISVLCSKDNEARMESYYMEMDTSEYPNRICFITSAYFTGYDISRPYHLILFTSILYVSTLLSISQIKQIIGRLRQDSHRSLTLIRRDVKNSDKINPLLKKLRELTLEKILESAEAMITSMNCLNHTMKNYQDELEVLKTFRIGALKALSDNNSSVIREKLLIDGRTIVKGNFVRSDFFIDSKKEQIRIFRENYDIGSIDNFNIEMIQNNIQLNPKSKFSEVEIEKVESFDKSINLSFLKELKGQCESKEYDFYCWLKKKQNSPMTKEIKKLIFFMLSLLRFYTVSEIIDKIIIKNMYDEKKGRMKDKRAFNNIKLKEEFKMAGEHFALRVYLHHYFKSGKIYDNNEISELLQIAAEKSNIDFGIQRKNIKTWNTLSSLFLIFKRSRKSKIDKKELIKVVDFIEPRVDSIFFKVDVDQLIKKKVLELENLQDQNNSEIPVPIFKPHSEEWFQQDSALNDNAIDFEELKTNIKNLS